MCHELCGVHVDEMGWDADYANVFYAITKHYYCLTNIYSCHVTHVVCFCTKLSSVLFISGALFIAGAGVAQSV